MTGLFIIVLITLHLIADYPLQGDFLAQNKGKNILLLWSHSFIWAGLITIGMYFLNMPIYASDFFYLLVLHGIIDLTKCHLNKLYPKYSLSYFLLIDQLLHIGQIFLLLYTKGILFFNWR